MATDKIPMTTATDWEGLLNSGITAYKQGDYAQAIATLQKLSRCPSTTLRTKAGMGLVRSYMAQQKWAKAKALCETIGASSKPAVQKWATDTLSKIEIRSQQPENAENLSGFTPLTDSNSQPNSARRPIQPLNNQSPPRQKTNSKATQTKATKTKTPQTKATKTKTPQTTESIQAPHAFQADSDAAVSMFHYAYLNNEIDEQGQPLNDTATAITPVKAGISETAHQYEWRNAGRLSKGRSLGKIKRQQIWFSQTFGAIALYALVLFVVRNSLDQYNDFLNFTQNLLPNWATDRLPIESLSVNINYLNWKVLGLLGVIAIAAPWLWDICLRFTTQRQAFSSQKLRQHSPEAASFITKRCQMRRWPVPKLWKLSTDVPLLFSYGWLPRNARLVFTDGLLSALSEEEIATLVSYEMSHWQTLYWPLLSLQGLFLLIFHQIYWQIALWGNRQAGPLRWIAGIVSNLSYCMFWITRLPGMWVNRVRTYYGDRIAVQLTGNPNALARALTKLSFALANSTQQQGYTPATAESFSLLLPVSMELTRSHWYGTLPLADIFAWDSQHPLRNWMSLLDEHPPLGDRLRLLMAYAKHWKLEPEILLPAAPTRKKVLSRQNWATLIQQGMPFFGLLFGSSIGLSCLLIGGLGRWLEWPALDWMYKDPGIFWFCPLIGLGIGTILRINRFFPDLTFGMKPSPNIPDQLCDPTLLPIDSIATKISGTLLGRPGLANWLGQDLMIKTNDGLLRLHIFSTLDAAIGPISTYFLLALGPFGNLISQRDRPANIIGKSVQVLGWLRRGNHIWLDVDKLRLNNGRLIEGTHPTTSLMVAIISSTAALWLLGFGQLFQDIWQTIR